MLCMHPLFQLLWFIMFAVKTEALKLVLSSPGIDSDSLVAVRMSATPVYPWGSVTPHQGQQIHSHTERVLA